ncbi:MAG: HEAT repeat domain-containing protein [Planctomycetota bacterium]|jgi:HEAT repeat protein
MLKTAHAITGLAVVACLFSWALTAAAADEALDKAFETLASYDWGDDRAALAPIDKAVADSHKDKAAQKALEERLAAVIGSEASRAAKDFACRKLSLVGSAESVPALAGLLTDERLSHMGRYALERIPAPEAVKALRDAVAKTKGRTKVGVINSLGVRRDAQSAAALVALLGDSDAEIASAAAAALGSIGTPEAAKALAGFQTSAPKALQLAAADAYLTCAERLLAAGKKLDAMGIYKSLSKSEHKHVGLAAKRGMAAAMGMK